MKRLLSLFICLFITILALNAQSTTFRFSMSSDGTGLCIDKYTGDSQYVVIQSSYDGLAVKEIGDYAFAGTDIISVKIPDCVEHILTRAFYQCYNLTTVTLPKGLDYIGHEAFAFCSNLYSVDVRVFLRAGGNITMNWAFFEGQGISNFLGCSSLPMSTQIQLIKLGYSGSF